jgi:hypothetical protein
MGINGMLDVEIFPEPLERHAIAITLGGLALFRPYFAENLTGNPTVANGFSTSLGYRFYF